MAIHLVALLCVLNHAGFAGSRMLMSLYALELGADQFSIGVIMALYALCPMLLAIYAGQLVDRVGPRLPMLAGTVGTATGLLLPYFFPGMPTLYIAALVLGTSFQFFFVAVHGTAGSIGGAENRVRNYTAISIGFSLAAFFGPLIAGFSIDHLGHLPAFLALAACTVVPMLMLWLGPDILPKAARGGGEGEQKRSAFDLLRDRELLNTIIASGLISTAWDLYQFYFPIYGHSIGLSASAIGMIIGTFAVAVFAIRVVLPTLVRKWTEFEILIYMIALAGISFLLFPLTENPYLLAAVSFLLGLGVGCGQPLSGSLIYTLSPPGRAAEGAGVRVMFNNVTHLGVPLLFGGIGTAFGFAPVFVSCSALLLFGSYYGHRSHARRRAA
ncbi:MAG: MFS transporter [Betaproteobacteria bacterium]|nr:MFS transporter [Betaproteobacteria bacterium]